MICVALASESVAVHHLNHCLQQQFGLRDGDVVLSVDRSYLVIPILTDEPSDDVSTAVVSNFVRKLRAFLWLTGLPTMRDLRGCAVGWPNPKAPPRPLDKCADPRRYAGAVHLYSMWIEAWAEECTEPQWGLSMGCSEAWKHLFDLIDGRGA